MKKIVILVVFVHLLFTPHALATPLVGDWNIENGITAVLDPEGDGGELGDEAVGRDSYFLSEPYNEHFWGFEGLIRTKTTLAGAFIDNGDGTGSLSVEIDRTGGTFTLHGDNLWAQPPGSVYEISIDSYFSGINYFKKVGEEWVWDKTIGSSYVWGTFKNDPFLFELTSHIILDKYGFNEVADSYAYMGTMNDVVMTIIPVPEPATMFLFGIGLLGFAEIYRKKK